MSEIERVQALRDAGHITPEEAERLIGVLRELDGDLGGAPSSVGAPSSGGAPSSAAAAPVSAVGPGPTFPGTPPGPPAPPSPPAPPGPTQPTVPPVPPGPGAPEVPSVPPGPAEPEDPPVPPGPGEPTVPPSTTEPEREAPEDSAPIRLAPDGTRWCAIELTAADVSVTAADVAEPVIESDDDQEIVITPTHDGVRIGSRRGAGLESWIGRMRSLAVDVRLPRAWGLALDLKAGTASVRDVRFVHGRMLAGELEVRGAEAVDLSKAAGDLTVEFRPTQGRHRIVSKAGDVDVILLPGSHAVVEGSVSIGDLHARGFEIDRRTVGGQARGRFGDGSARVEVRLTAGDLKLRAPRAEG
jgi:hypothetical protein